MNYEAETPEQANSNEKEFKYIAFFDLDDTILNTSSAKLFFEYAIEKGEMNFFEILDAIYSGILYKLGILNMKLAVDGWVKGLKDRPYEQLKKESEIWFRERVVQHIRPEIVTEIEKHRENKAMLVILSASTEMACNLMGRHLGFDAVISSRFEQKNGILTGRLDGKLAYAEQKEVLAKDLCKDKNIDIKKCWYYGDSYADRFVLNAVGHAVAVGPDAKLRKIATENNYHIICQ